MDVFAERSAVTGGRTHSLGSDAPLGPRSEWMVVIALDCQALDAWPEAIGLAAARIVSIGRGPERRLIAGGAQARLELPDRWISRRHARLVWQGDRFWLEDDGSRNGSWVNGERVARRPLDDGDVVEVGGTFLVVRRTDGGAGDASPLAERPEALRTLSPRLANELGVLRKVARSRIAVLVLGESGTGKEGVAGAIHALSGRDGPLVAANCGAIPATLVESELFGSRRGAFSGAEDRPGLVRSADRGTLFLDEIGELPMASQAALLRVLQEREVQPLGATRPLPVDVRVVAATNRPAGELVSAERLRRDLYARLNGYAVHLPPLRERREDLGLLVATLLARHDPGGAPRTLSRAAARALFAHDWPLNIRELEQALAAAVAVTGGEIGVEHLPRAVRAGDDLAAERQRLLERIRRHGGNLSAVARELATSRSQLYRMLARYGIRAEDTELREPPPATP